MVHEWLNQGANPNAENSRGETALHLVSRGQFDSQECGVSVVQLLLGRSANVNATDKGQISPLHLACYYGRLEIVRVLLNHCARVNTKDSLGQTPLHLVLEGNRGGRDGLSIVRLLLQHGADMNAQDGDNETPLHLASYYGKLAIGRVLLIYDANANAANIRGRTPLHMLSLWPWPVEDGSPFAEMLVDGGDADVNARDKDGETPLHTAYRNNRLDIAPRLLWRGADKGAKNDKGETPLQFAPIPTATK
jgi:ankyrin repeat protein